MAWPARVILSVVVLGLLAADGFATFILMLLQGMSHEGDIAGGGRIKFNFVDGFFCAVCAAWIGVLAAPLLSGAKLQLRLLLASMPVLVGCAFWAALQLLAFAFSSSEAQ